MEAKVRIYTDYWVEFEEGDSDDDIIDKAYAMQNEEIEKGWFVSDNAMIIKRR